MRICCSCEKATDSLWCAIDGHPTYRRIRRRTAELADGALIAGTWKVTGVLGRGGFATVYDACNEQTGEGLAIKVIRPPEAADRDEVVARFRREGQVCARLAHANTVQVFEHGELPDGRLYLAMERLAGESLRSMLSAMLDQGQRLDQVHVVQIAICILRSLEEAHGLGLVHRDLKPGNIFMARNRGGDWTPKVLDFGLVQEPGSRLTRAGQSLGTPWYMSPEQVQGQRVDSRSDIYAVGAVLYECLCGRPPFVSDTPMGVLLQHLDAAPAPLLERVGERVLPRLAVLVDKALAKKPAARWPDATAMRVELDAVLQVLAGESRITGPIYDVERTTAPQSERRSTEVYGAAELEELTLDAIETPQSAARSSPASTRSTEPTRRLHAADFPLPPASVAPPSTAGSSPARPKPSSHQAVRAVDLAALEAAADSGQTRLDHGGDGPGLDSTTPARLRLHFARTNPEPDHGARRRRHLVITGKPPQE